MKIDPIGGLGLRLQLYTVPGQVFYDATRKLVLNGADGVVFVADSQPAARDSNAESMSNLETNLAELGIELRHFPLVLQYNKRDVEGALPVEELRGELNPWGAPEFETVASRGEGLLPALHGITKLVIVGMQTHMCMEAAARAGVSEQHVRADAYALRVLVVRVILGVVVAIEVVGEHEVGAAALVVQRVLHRRLQQSEPGEVAALRRILTA